MKHDLIIVSPPIVVTHLPNMQSPSLIQIRQVSIDGVKGTTNSLRALTLSCSSAKPCQDVKIGDVAIASSINGGTGYGFSLR